MEQNREEIAKEAYNRVVKEGISLRDVSQEVGIERSKLKDMIESILSPEECTLFQNVLDRNNRRNNKGKGKRHKKEKALQGIDYQETIEKLAQRKVNPDWIESIYQRCQEKPQTKISRDTLAFKLLQLLEYFETRNADIDHDVSGYITDEDVVQMILKNPRMITSDVNGNIITKCVVLTAKNDGNIGLTNQKIKSNPGIFRKTVEAIKEGR